MGFLTPPKVAADISGRQAQYVRREHLTTWTGAGLLGLIALSAGDLARDILGDVPRLLTALIVTCVTVGAAALAFARVGFEWAGTKIARHIESRAAEDPAGNAAASVRRDRLPCTLERWPRFAEAMWKVALALVSAAGLLYVLAAWWFVFD